MKNDDVHLYFTCKIRASQAKGSDFLVFGGLKIEQKSFSDKKSCKIDLYIVKFTHGLTKIIKK